MGRKSLLGRPMTSAERSARRRAKKKEEDPEAYEAELAKARVRNSANRDKQKRTETPEEKAERLRKAADRQATYRERQRTQDIPDDEPCTQDLDSDDEFVEEPVDLTQPPAHQPGWVKRGAKRGTRSRKMVLPVVYAVS